MDAVSILRQLVGFDTTSRNSNHALIRWVVDYLEVHGARIRLTHDDSGHKANLLATLGPEGDGGVVLSGHTDVVPVDGQDWTTDPFVLAEQGERLHGRGTADMKGFIAACLAAAPLWSRAALKRPVHLAFSYDEEIGCLGAPRLVADLVAHVGRPEFAIIGEPTEMRIGGHHRGFYGYRTAFTGRPAHSSEPALGFSAIGPAADFVRFLLGGGGESGAAVNVARIDGGTAINIIPGRCVVTWAFRPATDGDVRELESGVARFLGEAIAREIGTATETVAVVPPLSPDPHGCAAAHAARLGGVDPAIPLAFGSEAGLFQQAGIPAVVCGPGSIAQAHQPDEWIARSELARATRFMEAVGDWAAA